MEDKFLNAAYERWARAGVFGGGEDLTTNGNYVTEVNDYLKIFSITKDMLDLKRLETEEKYKNALKYVLSFKDEIEFSFDRFT